MKQQTNDPFQGKLQPLCPRREEEIKEAMRHRQEWIAEQRASHKRERREAIVLAIALAATAIATAVYTINLFTR